METNQDHSTNKGDDSAPNDILDSFENTKSMADIPPEVVIDILEFLVILDDNRNNLLNYRAVSHLWKTIIDSLLEEVLVTDKLDSFPVMKIKHDLTNNRRRQPEIRELPEAFLTSQKPFPHNSLVLSHFEAKSVIFYLPSPNTIKMWVPLYEFMPKYALNLTSFGMDDIDIHHVNFLSNLLAAMPSLRILSLANVRMNKYKYKRGFQLPCLPSLINLTTLTMESCHEFSRHESVKFGNIVFIYVVANYADQVKTLRLDTYESLPAIQQGREYSKPERRTRFTFQATATSALAFTELTELKISHPTTTFLTLSNIPNLEKLSLRNLFQDNKSKTHNNVLPSDIQDILVFLTKFRKSLKYLCIDATWKQLIGERGASQYRLHDTMPPSIFGTIESPFSSLRSLEIHYPLCHCEELMLSSFISFFPTIQELHFLYFPEASTASIEEVKIINQAKKSEYPRTQADKIDELKLRITNVNQEILDKKKSYKQNSNTLLGSKNYTAMRKTQNEMFDFMLIRIHEKRSIFLSLAQLAVKKQDVVVEQLFQEHNIWNNCPDLFLVTGSSSGKRNGDVFVIRRINKA